MTDNDRIASDSRRLYICTARINSGSVSIYRRIKFIWKMHDLYLLQIMKKEKN